MKRLLSIVSLLAMFCMDYAEAELPNIDRTCTNCSRRYLDSLNVYNRRPIRMNQSGFRPQDYKYAYVADPKEMTFKVIDANSGKEVPGGGNLSLIKKGATKPNIWINGAKAFMSLVNRTPSAQKKKTCTEPILLRFRQRANTSLSWARTLRPHSMCTLPSTIPSSKTPCSSSGFSAAVIQIRTSTSPAT